MEYEISGLRQKLSNQEERSAQLKIALEKSEEESKEYGDLLIVSNQRADELEETAKMNQEKVDDYEKSHLAVEDSLQKANLDLLERDKLISELRQSTEDLSNELQIQKREASNATKQLKSLSEKAGQLGKENRTLIQRLEDMRQSSLKLETENSAIREQIQSTGNETETSSATDLIEFQQQLSEAESSLAESRKQLEEEKQRTKDLTLQLNDSKMNDHNNDAAPDAEKTLRTLQAQLDVERQKSREVLSQLETVRGEMTELRRRYMFILEENKQLNELVEAEVFEGDEFGAGMKDYEVNGDRKFTPDSALSPGQYGMLCLRCLLHFFLAQRSINSFLHYQLHMTMSEGKID
jgi:chromosome segregation ATPase